MSFFRPEIEAMSGYVPGEQPQDGEFIKLNTNENPYPPSPAVGRAIEEAARRLRKYPDPMAGAFRRRAAELLGVEPDWILCGNGSDDILTIVTRALVGQGPAAAAAVSELHPLQDAGRIAGRAERRGPLQRRLVAAGRVRRSGATICGWCFWPIRTAPRARSFRREQVLEIGRAVAVPAAGRRGLRRFRRDELHVAGGQVREDHGVADAEQVVRPGGPAVRLRRGPAADDRAVGQGEGLVQLRRAGDCRGHGRHRRPGVAGGQSGEDPRHPRAAGGGNAEARVCDGRFAGQLHLEHPSAPAQSNHSTSNSNATASWSDT